MTYRRDLRPLFATSSSQCKFCKAFVSDNKFVHDANCIVNIPGSLKEMGPFWVSGNDGGHLKPSANLLQSRSYQMGKNLREEPNSSASIFECADASLSVV